jgi:hypothetical protein
MTSLGLVQDVTVLETNWQRLHRIAEARRKKIGLTQSGLKALGGPSKAWVNSLPHMEGEPSTRHATPMARLDAVLRWPEGTSWDLASRDRSHDDPALLEDEERALIDHKDKITVFMYLVERRMRALPEDELRPAMLDIGRLLGLPVLDE